MNFLDLTINALSGFVAGIKPVDLWESSNIGLTSVKTIDNEIKILIR